MKIKILAPEVVDQIAAGEVVERPSHLVKELVENSLDAGATEIVVDFGMGGRFVKITDNGCGISREDLPLAFLRFATSKIETSDDLWKLRSFGFRGEALASISSVSQMTLFSSNNDSGVGHRLVCQFGKVGALEEVSRSRGTTVIVEELFQNVPARLKFMKSDSSEVIQIKQVLKAIAASRPEVSFRLMQDNKLLTFWPQKANWVDRIQDILEVKPLYEGTAVRGAIKAHAFFASPDETAKTSKQIWSFAQGRAIQDKSVQAAVIEAYRNLMMHGEFPIVCVFIDAPTDQIDVNIHPTKSQVKFLYPQDVFRAVQAAIRNILNEAPWIQAKNQDQTYSKAEVPEAKGSFVSQQYKESPSQSGSSDVGLALSRAKPMVLNDPAFEATHYRKRTPLDPSFAGTSKAAETESSQSASGSAGSSSGAGGGWNLNKWSQPQEVLKISDYEKLKFEIKPETGFAESAHLEVKNNESQDLSKNLSENLHQKLNPSLHQDLNQNFNQDLQQNLQQNLTSKSQTIQSNERTEAAIPKVKGHFWSSLEVIGQANLTYIVCQSQKGLLLVDQHAAHERVAFEKIMTSMKNNKVDAQKFLIPLAVDLNEEKIEALRSQSEALKKIGIEIEELGPTTIGITAAPSLFKDHVLVEEIQKFAQEIIDHGVGVSFDKVIADICASLACHSVVRAGQSLSLDEMKKLLQQMDEFPLSCYCPHGRPVSIDLSWTQLEKDFGRIV